MRQQVGSAFRAIGSWPLIKRALIVLLAGAMKLQNWIGVKKGFIGLIVPMALVFDLAGKACFFHERKNVRYVPEFGEFARIWGRGLCIRLIRKARRETFAGVVEVL